ncbi:hypothetical protein FHQ18_03115 [Deferribacter autotrophicus]|uniref:Uncharacterized protein n=1 Tax=Deferribacter autotrophicus TaxID=500465 RepID=A0A5A8F6A9_9BACT|nr:hypothetical protein FHQ18_03115 [Deferribacter autotrophicus]
MKLLLRSLTLIFLLFTVISTGFAQDSPLLSLKKLFPDVNVLEGGELKWLTTAFDVEKSGDYITLRRHYTYFGDKETTILDIKRKKTFKIVAMLFFAKNALKANELFSDLKQMKADFSKKISVGDKGIIFAKRRNNGFNADYTLIFLMNNFVVKLEGDDGFAVVDFADYFVKSIRNFIAENLEYYLLNSIVLKVEKEGFLTKEKEINISEGMDSDIVIEGHIEDFDGNYVSDARIYVKGISVETKSNQNGDFRIFLKLNKNKKKVIKTKLYLEKKKNENKSLLPVYLLMLEGNKIYNNIYIKPDIQKVFKAEKNKIFDLNIENFSIEENRFNFTINCSKGSFFKCQQMVSGEIDNDGSIKGSWFGTGGKGEVKGFILKKTNSVKYPVKKFCKIMSFAGNVEGNILKTNQHLLLGSLDDYLNLLFLDCSKLLSNYFVKEVTLNMFFPNENINRKELVLFTGNISDNLYQIYDEILKGAINNGVVKFQLSGNNVYEEKFLIVYNGMELLNMDDEKSFVEVEKYDFNINAQQGKMFAKFIPNNKDYVSFRNRIAKDGKPDIAIKLTISQVKGNLKQIDVVSKGSIKLLWNTNPLDIYPAIAVFERNRYLNDEKGRINLKLDGNKKDFVLYIAGSELMDKRNTELILRIDNEKYKVRVED